MKLIGVEINLWLVTYRYLARSEQEAMHAAAKMMQMRIDGLPTERELDLLERHDRHD